ncbi:MAG TPA: CBS domain-containing protein [Anaerolineae bacterium]|jgi:CBS domain-containing protein|nr:CBS domain-containing protein [Anaerolineae bacterium]
MDLRSILATKSRQIITIGPEQTLAEALMVLQQHDIGALVVLGGDNEVVGIISERDIVRVAADDQGFFRLRVEQVMTRDVVLGIPEDDVIHVAHVMTERRFRHLPVVDADKHIIGIISIGDVLKSQRDKFQGEIDTLETQILADD